MAHVVAAPLYVALLEREPKRRLVCIDAVDGSRRPDFDAVLTTHLSEVVADIS
jgi:hypothetical protein